MKRVKSLLVKYLILQHLEDQNEIKKIRLKIKVCKSKKQKEVVKMKTMMNKRKRSKPLNLLKSLKKIRNQNRNLRVEMKIDQIAKILS